MNDATPRAGWNDATPKPAPRICPHCGIDRSQLHPLSNAIPHETGECAKNRALIHQNTILPPTAPLTEAELAELNRLRNAWSAAPAGCGEQEASLIAFKWPRAIATIEAQSEQLKSRDAEWTRAVVPWWSMTLTPEKAAAKVDELYVKQRETIRRLRAALETEHEAAEYSEACKVCALLRETEAEQ